MATKDRTTLKDEFKNGNLATGERFADLIDSVKVVQEPVADPAASGTSHSFIASIEQDKDGKITATKKNVQVVYAQIQDKPTINGVTLMGDNTPAQLGLATANQVGILSDKVDKLPTGYYYGKFSSVEDLPEATEKGYAYVASSDPTVFYTYLVSGAGAEWVDSGNKMVNTVDITTPKTAETELSKDEKYYASANVNDRPADVVIETGVVKALGYKLLNPAMSFAEQVEGVDNVDTVFEIKDEFDLGSHITTGVLTQTISLGQKLFVSEAITLHDGQTITMISRDGMILNSAKDTILSTTSYQNTGNDDDEIVYVASKRYSVRGLYYEVAYTTSTETVNINNVTYYLSEPVTLKIKEAIKIVTSGGVVINSSKTALLANDYLHSNSASTTVYIGYTTQNTAITCKISKQGSLENTLVNTITYYKSSVISLQKNKSIIVDPTNTLVLDSNNEIINVDTIYINRDDTPVSVTLASTSDTISYVLGGNVTIPTGCVLQFNGGKLINGVIDFNNAEIKTHAFCFDNVMPTKDCKLNQNIKPEWFGACGDDEYDDTHAWKQAILFAKNIYNTGLPNTWGVNFGVKIEGDSNGVYAITDTLVIDYNVSIIGGFSFRYKAPIISGGENVAIKMLGLINDQEYSFHVINDNAAYDSFTAENDYFFIGIKLGSIESKIQMKKCYFHDMRIRCANEGIRIDEGYVVQCTFSRIRMQEVLVGFEIITNDSSWHNCNNFTEIATSCSGNLAWAGYPDGFECAIGFHFFNTDGTYSPNSLSFSNLYYELYPVKKKMEGGSLVVDKEYYYLPFFVDYPSNSALLVNWWKISNIRIENIAPNSYVGNILWFKSSVTAREFIVEKCFYSFANNSTTRRAYVSMRGNEFLETDKIANVYGVYDASGQSSSKFINEDLFDGTEERKRCQDVGSKFPYRKQDDILLTSEIMVNPTIMTSTDVFSPVVTGAEVTALYELKAGKTLSFLPLVYSDNAHFGELLLFDNDLERIPWYNGEVTYNILPIKPAALNYGDHINLILGYSQPVNIRNKSNSKDYYVGLRGNAKVRITSDAPVRRYASSNNIIKAIGSTEERPSLGKTYDSVTFVPKPYIVMPYFRYFDTTLNKELIVLPKEGSPTVPSHYVNLNGEIEGLQCYTDCVAYYTTSVTGEIIGATGTVTVVSIDNSDYDFIDSATVSGTTLTVTLKGVNQLYGNTVQVGYVNISDGTNTCKVKVSRQTVLTQTTSAAQQEFTANGGSATVEYQINNHVITSSEIICLSDWISAAPSTANRKVIVTVAPNPSSTARWGAVTVKDSVTDIAQTKWIFQSGSTTEGGE